MNFRDHCYVINEKIFFAYDLSSDDWVNDLEKKIFCVKSETSYIVHYKHLSNDDIRQLNIRNAGKDVCLLPFHQTGILYDFLCNDSNFLVYLKRHKNSDKYFKKWIYQIVNAIYDIHVNKNIYHGFLSDQCIFIDDKLNSQIGFIGIYDLDSFDPYRKNFIKYFDASRLDIFEKCHNNFLEYFRLEKKNKESIDRFRDYDIYSLGILLRNILESMKNRSKDTDSSNDDQSFENRLENEIIKLCLQPPTERPNISTIKLKLDELINKNLANSNDIIDVDEFLSGNNLSRLKEYNASNLIAYKIEKNPSLLKYLHTSTDLTRVKFMLHDNYKFQVSYNIEEDYFLTKPILIDNNGLRFTKTNFSDQIELKMDAEELFYSFFGNIYFCSLRELLKIHRPSYEEIHYWAMRLSNQIASYHSGNFLENQDKYEQNSSDTRLPCNFSSETVFVSFINYKECTKSKVFANPLQFQLSIFPFDSKQTKLSQIYQSNKIAENRTKKNDLFSFGVLLLELLSKASTGMSCFDGVRDDDNDDDDNDHLRKLSFTALENLHLPKEQDFYREILDKCLNMGTNDIFDIQSLLIYQGKNPENDEDFPDNPSVLGDEDESSLISQYVSQNSIMNRKRFTDLFKCYTEIPENELPLRNIYHNTLNELNQEFFNKKDFDLFQEIEFLNLNQFLDNDK